jgi:Protein-tyrosine-phosphatase
MAAGLLTQLSVAAGLPFEVQSAGIWPQVADPVAPNAVRAMHEVGIDISADHPKEATSELISWADVIIPVDPQHGEELDERFEGAWEKIEALDASAKDPYGGDLGEYRACRDTLRASLVNLVVKLKAISCDGQ